MIACLSCRSNLIEAFQHLLYKFVICRKCFYQFVLTYNFNEFCRISLLKNNIPIEVKNRQEELIYLIQRQNISLDDIFSLRIMNLYEKNKELNNKKQDATSSSTIVSPDTSPQKHISYNLYQNYNWLKEKLETKYNFIKQSRIGTQITQNISPIKQKMVQKTNTISNKLLNWKNQFKSLMKQAPSLQQLKNIKIFKIIKEQSQGLIFKELK